MSEGFNILTIPTLSQSGKKSMSWRLSLKQTADKSQFDFLFEEQKSRK